jgi:hypothetical protein
MLRIGHVDLGTTHPAKFIEVERTLGYEPIGVFDDFRIYDEAKAKAFAEANKVKFYRSLDELAGDVDVAFIHSVNWDQHIGKLMPFVERGKGVYIDKPVCGNLSDINKIKSLVRGGAIITGGSMIIFSDTVRSINDSQKSVAPNIHLAMAGGPSDVYYYGAHVYYMLASVMGYDFSRVRYLGASSQKMYDIEWQSGKKAVISIGDTTQKYFPFHMTLVSDAGATHFSIKGFEALKNMLTEVIPFIAGKGGKVPPVDSLLNCEIAALAGLKSETSPGKFVALSEVDESVKYDGAHYERIYGKK